jgi:hypothetical protein
MKMRKIPPGLLALALLVSAVVACNFNVGGDGEVHVDELYAAKDGGGKAGDKTTNFSPSERTVYAVAKLDEAKADTKIKLVWYTLEVEGQDKNTMIKDIEVTTNDEQNIVYGHLTLPQDWPKGKYKVEAYVNGKLEKTVEYSVQ